jgi:hypothetical protein
LRNNWNRRFFDSDYYYSYFSLQRIETDDSTILIFLENRKKKKEKRKTINPILPKTSW